LDSLFGVVLASTFGAVFVAGFSADFLGAAAFLTESVDDLEISCLSFSVPFESPDALVAWPEPNKLEKKPRFFTSLLSLSFFAIKTSQRLTPHDFRNCGHNKDPCQVQKNWLTGSFSLVCHSLPTFS
jgi:hypothetical protein